MDFLDWLFNTDNFMQSRDTKDLWNKYLSDSTERGEVFHFLTEGQASRNQ